MIGLIPHITMAPEQCGGRPCIHSMSIRVNDVLNLFANGLSVDEILEEMPDLEHEDIYASLKFASRSLDHPMVAARGLWKYRTDLPYFTETRSEMDRFVKDE